MERKDRLKFVQDGDVMDCTCTRRSVLYQPRHEYTRCVWAGQEIQDLWWSPRSHFWHHRSQAEGGVCGIAHMILWSGQRY